MENFTGTCVNLCCYVFLTKCSSYLMLHFLMVPDLKYLVSKLHKCDAWDQMHKT